MTLVGESRANGARTVPMRMGFLDVTADTLRWEWQQTVDSGATWAAQMIIEHHRRR